MSKIVTKALSESLQVGKFALQHRVVLAPLTRCRSDDVLAPRPMNVEYYKQRASPGGLLISEATHISGESVGYAFTPGIWTEKQVEQWKKVTDAVHEEGGYIVCQLWHTGRVAHAKFADIHPIVKEGGLLPPVSASATPMPGRDDIPRALKLEEIPRLIENYKHACECAKKAGFDGVEVHAAHGYLIDQFLNDHVNKRTDKYGGSIENRARLLLEVIDTAIDVWGEGRVSVRLSPHTAQSMKFYFVNDSNPDAIYEYALKNLAKRPLSYVLLTEPRWNSKYDSKPLDDPGFTQPLINARWKKVYPGVLLGGGGFTPKSAEEAVSSGDGYDAVAFGRWFIANPDLPKRVLHGLPLNRYNRATFYSHEEEGYTDYPFYPKVDERYPLIEQSKIGQSLSEAKL